MPNEKECICPSVKKGQALGISISEANWQRTVIELAHIFGWAIHAERHALTKDGHWLTPIQGDAGFPDLVLARCKDGKRRIIFAELKSEKGALTKAQKEWLDLLGGYLWKPSGYEIVKALLE